MMRSEFVELAMRNNADIGGEMYNAIERLYTSENEYHATNNPDGVNENKRDFVKRVFGGKVNTPKTICEKLIAEVIRENRYLLRNNNVSKAEFDRMDAVLREHYEAIHKNNW